MPGVDAMPIDIVRWRLADMQASSEWYLRELAYLLIHLWEWDSSLMSRAVLSPDATARLIADILDAAPPSLLELPAE